jgi:excinuclease UvrABC helicase subunit UvrB
VWHDEDTEPPTKEEVEAEIERLKEEYDNLEYQRLRKKEYPSIEDQLDILYHKGIEGWKLEIDKVKNKYPKPQ